jgi:putative inorganic carbon (hco3(-)) transporter
MTVFNLLEKKALVWRNEYLAWFSLATIVGFTWLPFSYYLMMSWHWIALWQAGFFCLGAYLIISLRTFDRPFQTLGYGFDRLILVFFCGLSGSILFAAFQQVAVWQTTTIVCYIVLLYILRNWLGSHYITPSRLHQALAFVGIVTGCIGLQGWWEQLLVGNYRNPLPLGHHNFVAGYCVLLVPITFSLALIHRGWQRYALLAGTILLGFVLYTTSSRGGYLGFVAMALGTAILFLWHSPKQQRIQRIAIVAVALILIGIAALNNPRVQRIIQVGNNEGNTPLVQLKVDSESNDRLLMLQSASKLIKDRPFFGVGPGNMSRSYNRYRSIYTGIGAVNVQQLHDTPLHIIGELGLVGLSCYLVLLGFIARLFFKLDRQLTESNDKYLLYGIGASFLGYAFSSLTDYQLENIAISSTLVVLLAMLIGLADKAELPAKLSQPQLLKPRKRRLLSLACLTIAVSFLLIWLPVSRAMQLSDDSFRSFSQGEITNAYELSAEAANLVPWDPTYSLLSVDRVLIARSNVPVKDKLYAELTDIALKNLEKTQQAAPNDDLFNYFLGMMYLSKDEEIQKAQFHLGRSIQLVPRSPFYTYYLLALTYAKQRQIDKAIHALALQTLITPDFLTDQIWDNPLITDLYEPTAKETIQLLTKLVDRLTPENPNYESVVANLTFLKWWTKQPLGKYDQKSLRPIMQAIFLAETQPQAALDFVEKTIRETGESDSLFILRAWLAPEKYLPKIVTAKSDMPIENRVLITNSIKDRQKLREWLYSLDYGVSSFSVPGFRLAYRNNYANAVANFPYFKGISLNFLTSALNLTSPFPYTFDRLDELIVETIAEKLDLPAISEGNRKI